MPREAMPDWIWPNSRTAGNARKLNARRRVRGTMDSIRIIPEDENSGGDKSPPLLGLAVWTAVLEYQLKP